MTTPKILLAVDLDFTHFNTDSPDIAWLGKKEAWLDMYNEAYALLARYGIECIFAVISHKPQFNDIAEETAKTFRFFLKKHNPLAYSTIYGEECCLVKRYSKLGYQSFYGARYYKIPEKVILENKIFSNLYASDECSSRRSNFYQDGLLGKDKF